MPYEPSELGALAKRLEAAAGVALAKAKQHTLAGETKHAEHQQARADDAHHFAAVCSHFQNALTKRVAKKRAEEQRPQFKAPTLEEVRAFVNADEICKGWQEEDLRAWYDHFQSNGWKVSGVTVMKDWKAAARNGARRWKKDNAKRPLSREQSETDPDGWVKWLQSVGRPYEKYRYALEYMRDDFAKWKRA